MVSAPVRHFLCVGLLHTYTTIEVAFGQPFLYNKVMNISGEHHIMQYNLSLMIERAEYLKIKNSPHKYRIVDEKSEFTKENEHIVLVHYVDEWSNKIVNFPEVYDVDILNLGLDLDRSRYEELYKEKNVEKECVGFNKKHNCFFAAIYFKENKSTINNTFYPEV